MTKTLDENFIDWENYVFGFGYGTGETHVLAGLKQFLELCPEDGYDYKTLEREMTPVVAWLFINIMAQHKVGMIEYGVSPRYAWLTKNGKELRKFVCSKTTDELVDLSTGYGVDYYHCTPDICNCGPDGYKPGNVCYNPFWRR